MLLPRTALASALSVAVVLGGAGIAAASDEPAPTEQLVVQFEPGTSASERAAAIDDAGLTLVESVDDEFAVVRAPVGEDVTGGAIVDADEPLTMQALEAPNDPYYGSQWNFPAVQAEQAWTRSTGAGAVVAIVDSGVSPRADFAAGTLLPGYDFVANDADPNDENGHGTHVAGTVAQATNDGVGTAGLAYGAKILPVRVLNASGSGTDYAVAQGIDYAVGHGADVINLSLGGPTPSSVLQSAIGRAASAGVVVVAAAGNDGGVVSYPAAFPEVLAVGAVTSTQTRATFSAHGPELDLVAPGVGILQVMPDGSVTSKSGTSMATPHVAAAAAILASVGATDIRSALLSTAKDLGPAGRDDDFGAGLLQVASAVDLVAPAPAVAPAPGSTGGGGGGGGGAATDPTTADPVDDDPNTTPPVQDEDQACPVDAVPRGSFDDVDPSSVHARAVDCVSWLGIANGVAFRSFQPGAAVTRGQMATFLARALEHAGVTLPASPPDAFVDDAGSPHELATNQLAALGVVRGTGPGTYTPSTPVSRAAMATFLVAVHDLAGAIDLPAGADRFSDDDGNVHEAAIGRLARAGIATGTGVRVFEPGTQVSRAQLATFVARTIDALVDSGDIPG